MAPEPPSPSSSSVLLPFLGARSRRGSLASIASKRELDRDAIAQALDHIHISASKSDALTSFHDFDGSSKGVGSAKELVSNGMNNLYSRLRTSVSGPSPLKEDSLRSVSRSGAFAEPPSPASTANRKHRYSLQEPASATTLYPPILPVLADNKDDSVNTSSPISRVKSESVQPSSGQSLTESVTKDSPKPSTNRHSKSRFSLESASVASDTNLADDSSLNLGRDDAAVESLSQNLSRMEHAKQSQLADRSSLASSDSLPSDKLTSHSRASTATHKSSATNGIDQKSAEIKQKDAASRPSMVHVGVSHLPGFQPSAVTSPVTDETYSFMTQSPQRLLEPSPNLNSGMQRSRTSSKHQSGSSGIPTHLKRRVISKEFWMKDENAKVCFDCGQSFSTFRRKHHCRTCGQIFDSKCTSIISAHPFGQPGQVRLCKPCEQIVLAGKNDDSSVYSDDGEELPRSPEQGKSGARREEFPATVDEVVSGQQVLSTPTIGIPASRRNREAKRRSAVIEFDAEAALARPTSSRSLAALGSRPRSSSHKRHSSRARFTRSSKSGDNSGPFLTNSEANPSSNNTLPVFHNDNIIDPDLAPYLSDEESEEDEPIDIFTAMNGPTDSASLDRDRQGLSTFLNASSNKSRRTRADRGQSISRRDDDAVSMMSRRMSRSSRHGTSVGSVAGFKPSPRRSRSNRFLKGAEHDDHSAIVSSPIEYNAKGNTKIIRSAAMQSCEVRRLELNKASFEHARKLLRQILADTKAQDAIAWEKALLPVLMQCTDDVDPDVPRGDDMDIRHYVKLKKVPGGKPGDTSYVSGVVFSKNVALKSMPRSIQNPRIAIVTFAIEYARHQAHFMSLEPVIAQEREYLNNLVGRIAALRPQLLLVQRNVSGLALSLFEKAGIAVAYNIKDTVLAAVARMTQTTIIKSVDKLTIDPHHLGRCEAFDVKTYVHDSIKKSYIVLSGCQPDLGCTIVLRGGDISTLRTMKRITEFMCYVVYNLKLENYLMRDEFISIPAESQAQLISVTTPGGYEPASNVSTEKLHDQQYSDYARTEQEAHSRILSASPFVAFMQPYLLTQLRDTEQKLARFKSLRDTYAAADEEGDTDQEKPIQHRFSVVRPDMVDMHPSKEQPKAVRDYLHAVHSAQFDRALATYETQKKLWQAFIANGANPFDPFSHQTIVVLHSIVSSITSAPCVGPELLGIGFYSGYNRAEVGFEEDCTLGQYVEDIVIASKTACKECDRPMSDHHRQYVHGYGQMTISVQAHPSRMSGMSNIILMWSRCRLCTAETTVVPMSDNTWKYSFAKYLELAFWSRPMHPRAGVCEHDINKDFLRCFGYQEQVVKVQYDSIDLYDIVVPRPTVLWKVEADLNVKNEQYQLFESRLNAFVDSVKKRLSTINVDTLDEKQMTEAQSTLDALHKRADDDRKELLDKLQAKYSTSRYYELIPLNRALRFMDEKALSWDDTFSAFETDYFPSETDIRKLAAAQLKEMFYGSQQSTDSIVSENSDNESGSELTTFRPKSLGQKVADGEISDEKAHGMLASVAQEHRPSTRAEDEKTADGDSAESLLSQRLSPTENHQTAVQQETVKHLDLAVASTSPDKHDEGAAAYASQDTNADAQMANNSQLSEDLSTSGLLQRVEQIRSDKPAGVKPVHGRESKLRRPNNFGRLTEGSPTLLRAQSQPSSIARLNRDNTDNSERNASVEPNLESPPLERRLNDRLIRLGSRLGNLPPSLIPRSIPTKTENGPTSTVSALAKHFEHLSREFERERLRERRLRAAKSRQARANPLASSRPTVEVYRNATDAVVERRTESPAVRNRTTQRILGLDHAAGQAEKGSKEAPKEDPPASQQMTTSQQEVDKEMNTTDTEVETDVSDTENAQTFSQDSTEVGISDLSGSTLLSPSAQDIELHPELSIPEHKRNVWLKVLAEFWSKRSASGWSSLDYPLHSDEHVFEDSDIIVREDEPSSVIALSLASNDYLNKAKEFRSSMAKTNKAGSTDVDVDAQETSIEASLLSDTGTHMKYSFSHGHVKASCKIFYAEAFDALRRRTGVSSRFVESLSRCMKFDSKGGKTKSLFLKSLDNRFIIKSLQEVEVKAFTKFAPDYFAFMSHTLFRGVPSVIAKMFGLFQVSIKNPSSGMDFNYYLLVMENLFYDHTPNRRFDLKGSMRNRKIESTGQPDEVLLDENLVETIFESPLFVREHSRKLLQASVWNDTLWLCKQNVMDYSLMAGFEDDTRQLVVGIIDCIRTYTWDKKLESWIKDRGKNKPTITSPKDYRNRFRVSMMQYVLQAPNCWHQFQASMAPLKTLREKDDLTAPEELAAEKSEITMR